jgi:hypothetical protein
MVKRDGVPDKANVHPDILRAYGWLMDGNGSKPIVAAEHQCKANDHIRDLIRLTLHRSERAAEGGDRLSSGKLLRDAADMMERLDQDRDTINSTRWKAARQYSIGAVEYLAEGGNRTDPAPATLFMECALEQIKRIDGPDPASSLRT